MKRLLNYILESQAIGQIIDFELFKEYIDKYILRDDSTASKQLQDEYTAIVQQVHDKISEHYPHSNTIMRAIDKYCSEFIETIMSYHIDIDDNIIRLLYDKITNEPTSKLDHLLGVGSNAAVIDLGDKVIKMFFSNNVQSYQRVFFEACRKKHYKYFPEIYRIGKGYVVMEKLQTDTKKCRKYASIFDNRDFYYSIFDNTCDDSKLNKQQLEVANWLRQILSDLDDISLDDHLADLTLSNIGEREDGTIIFFDI